MIYPQLSDLSIPNLKKTIQHYHSLDFKNVSISDVDKIFKLIIKNYITQTVLWQEPVIFRARKHIGDSYFKNISELIYHTNPPKYGRLNDIGESLFYGASNHDTTLLEMRPRVNEEFTILESRLINPSVFPKFMEIGIRELMFKQKGNLQFIQNSRISIQRHLGTNDNKKRYDLINSFLIKEITKIVDVEESYNYKGTIAIGQFFIKKNNFADGMLYPSISRLGAECIALLPKSYHQLYYPHHCAKCKILNVKTDGSFQVECIAESSEIDINGDIIWLY